MRILELFCGIGGCAAAVEGAAEIVAAVDINTNALAVYRHNFRHPTQTRSIESIPIRQFAAWDAEMWWLSPPCQPYTSRGLRRDLDDPRAAALIQLMAAIERVRPPYLAMENVPGFELSRTRTRLLNLLAVAGYEFREQLLCPTELGVPNRRRRYYLLASRDRLLPPQPAPVNMQRAMRVCDLLDMPPAEELKIPSQRMADYARAVHVVDPDDPDAITSCFTSAYGRSITASGSFLKTSQGFRRFSPGEILRLLCYPAGYRLLESRPPRFSWPLVGNSLSVAVVRHILSAVLPLT